MQIANKAEWLQLGERVINGMPAPNGAAEVAAKLARCYNDGDQEDEYRFTKSRARLIYRALHSGRAERRNTSVAFDADQGIFYFAYQDVVLLQWDVQSGRTEDVFAGEYDSLHSTRGQRKAARAAVHDFMRNLSRHEQERAQ